MTCYRQGGTKISISDEAPALRVPDKHYYRARAQVERSLASQSGLPQVAALHIELAEEYETLVRLADVMRRFD